MKKVFLSFIILLFSISSSQAQKVYKYYLHLSNYNAAHRFVSIGGMLSYSGTSDREKSFFDKYQILEYRQAFEDAIDIAALNVFYLETYDSILANDLKKEFPGIYLITEDVTNWKIESLGYYPNDYGTSSPNPNLGFAFNRKEYDYINVPKAWGITTGSSDIKIGILDTPIYYTDPDFLGKVTPIQGYNLVLVPNSHGTDVAATAAARGNNGYGSVGVCMDCSIIAGPMAYNTADQNANLYKMANAGARVINMSYRTSFYLNLDGSSPYYFNPDSHPILAEQIVVNDIVNNFGVTLVAASGNQPSFGTPISNIYGAPYGVIELYPASYDNVISVSSIHHQYSINLPLSTSDPSYCCTSSLFPVYLNLEDSVSHSNSGLDPMNPVGVNRNGYYQNPNNPDGFQNDLTLNPKVDILAPGNRVFGHYEYLNNPLSATTTGTSLSSPTVAGTIGLMLSINECLLPREIESILKLSTKDVENLPLNQNFVGYMGAGKLEVGDTVEFVDEMKKYNGNAVVDNHIFNRFELTLTHVNNQLSIENITFKEKCKADFTARNIIDITKSDFKPNEDGFVDLKLDEDMNVTCSFASRVSNSENKKKEIKTVLNQARLFPNPNTGAFTISFENKDLKNVSVVVYDVLGKPVYHAENIDYIFDVNLTNLASGMYFVKLSANNFSETLKFIKK